MLLELLKYYSSLIFSLHFAKTEFSDKLFIWIFKTKKNQTGISLNINLFIVVNYIFYTIDKLHQLNYECLFLLLIKPLR